VLQGSGVQSSQWFCFVHSLRARLLLLLFLTLLPVYGFILYSVFEVHRQAEENARSDALSLARRIAQEQEGLIRIIRQQLLDLAQLPVVRRPESASQCNQAVADLLKQNPLYTNAGVIDPDGTLRCSAAPLTGRVDLSDRRYFIEAMSTRTFVIGDYQTGRVTGRTAVNLAYPVLDAAGHPLAVVYIALGLGALSDSLIETAALPENATVTIMNDRGTILARLPDPETWIGKSLPESALFKAIFAL
jgi:hypothetical protein